MYVCVCMCVCVMSDKIRQLGGSFFLFSPSAAAAAAADTAVVVTLMIGESSCYCCAKWSIYFDIFGHIECAYMVVNARLALVPCRASCRQVARPSQLR